MAGGLCEREAARADAADAGLAEVAFAIEPLVAPGTVGQEHQAQHLAAEEFQRPELPELSVSRVPIPEDTALDPAACVRQQSDEGRYDIHGAFLAGSPGGAR
jgi:hypothetical protein